MKFKRYSWQALAAGVVVCFWLLYLTDSKVQASWIQYLSSRARPSVLNGLEVPFDRFVIPPPPTVSATSRRLVIVSSDRCRYSEAAVPSWITLIRRLDLLPNDDILFVSTYGRKLHSQLIAGLDTSTATHIRFATVKQQAVFAQTTGISWTPELVGIDGDGRVRLATEIVDERTAELFREFFLRQK